MDDIKKRVKNSGLKSTFLAKKLEIGAPHLSMMLSGKATMPTEIKFKIMELIKQAEKISV